MRFNRLFVFTVALTFVAWTALELRGQERELPEAIQNVLESLDIDHEHANVEVNIEKEDGRTEIHIIVEPAGKGRHDHSEHDEEHGDWRRGLEEKAHAIEKAIVKVHEALEEASDKFSNEHPKVRELKKKKVMLARAMKEIESKLESNEDDHARLSPEVAERKQEFFVRLSELELEMVQRQKHYMETHKKFGEDHPRVRDLRLELVDLERAIKETHEGIEEIEHGEHEHEHEHEHEEEHGDEHDEHEDHDEEEEVVEELFERLEGLDDRMDGIEEQLDVIIEMLEKDDE